MNTKQLKAAAASLILTGTAVTAAMFVSTSANAWPCVPRCGTPVSTPTPSAVTTVGPGQPNPSPVPIGSAISTVGPGGR